MAGSVVVAESIELPEQEEFCVPRTFAPTPLHIPLHWSPVVVLLLVMVMLPWGGGNKYLAPPPECHVLGLHAWTASSPAP